MLRFGSALLVVIAVALSGCGEQATCRPHSLFVRFGSSEGFAVVDALQVTVAVDNAELNASVPYKGGDTLEIDLGDHYKDGEALILAITMLQNGDELWRLEQPIPSLPPGCTTLSLFLPSVDLGGPGADLKHPEPDQSVPSDLEPATKANGATCSTGPECTSGQCVDGRCCSAACDGQCEACDVPTLEGVCAPVIGAPHGGRTGCAGTGECAGACNGSVRTVCVFPQATTVCSAQSCDGSTKTKPAGCDGAGACLAGETLTCPQGCSGNDCLGACADDAACSSATPSTPYCDAGVCTAGKPKGRACTMNSECTSGQCADGFCCSSTCDSQCESCKEAGLEGTCVRITGAPRSGGAPTRAACSGSDVCIGVCDGTNPTCVLPTSSTSCGAQSCSGGQLTTVGSCSSGACSQMTTPCANGNCASGTECGPCTDNAQCGSGRYCDSGTCRTQVANGGGCSADVQCTSGFCEDDSAGTSKVCCAADCSGGTPRCKADFTGCKCISGSCGSGQVCNPSTQACCGCASGCRTFASCGGACGATCTTNCCCGTTNDKCCSTGQQCR